MDSVLYNPDTAIDQIHQKKYPQKIADYTGEILLVGINYDKETKLHSCKIEKLRIIPSSSRHESMTQLS